MSQEHDQHYISISPHSLPNSDAANPIDWLHDTEPLCHQLKVKVTEGIKQLQYLWFIISFGFHSFPQQVLTGAAEVSLPVALHGVMMAFSSCSPSAMEARIFLTT